MSGIQSRFTTHRRWWADEKLFVREIGATGRMVLEHPFDATVGVAAFSTDGAYVAGGVLGKETEGRAVSTNYRADVIRLQDRRVATTVSDNGTIGQITFNPRLPISYIGSVGSHLRAMNLLNGQPVWEKDVEGVWSLAVSADGQYVAAGIGSRAGLNTMRVFDAANGGEVVRTAHSKYVTSIRFDAASRTVISTAFDGSVSHIEIPANAPPLPGGNDFSLSASGKFLAVASVGTSRVLETGSGKEILTFGRGDQYSGRVAIASDEQHALIANQDGSVSLYELQSRTHLWAHREAGPVGAIAFSGDSSRIVTCAAITPIGQVPRFAPGKTDVKSTAAIRETSTGVAIAHIPQTGTGE